ncbi:hypothetical protein BN3087_910005 [Sulfurovum sp. enrichment culture clone C5]|uniref:Uncharacterized protein n=1 Tax=Sulfurovum sp. enrichment culture clone C5 TaxID=497650 RepID=A0A0S4XRE7_9BACT|nr:hypothetical protein BN3087_910005 [Sulfurovum sp. enrichment culture clone C5]
MKMKKILPITIVLFILAVTFLYKIYNQDDIESSNGYSCNEIREKYYFKHSAQTKRDFQKFDLNKQYAIYICAADIHPVIFIFSDDISKNGAKMVPYLKNKLLQANNSIEIKGILEIFYDLKRNKIYDIKNDKKLIKIFEHKIHNYNQNNNYLYAKDLNDTYHKLLIEK